MPADELARLRCIEEAAKRLLTDMEGRRSATTVLTAIAELRAALNAKPFSRGLVSTCTSGPSSM